MQSEKKLTTSVVDKVWVLEMRLLVDDGGGRSGRRWRSPPSSHPSTIATHRREEDDEAELLDTMAELGKA